MNHASGEGAEVFRRYSNGCGSGEHEDSDQPCDCISRTRGHEWSLDRGRNASVGAIHMLMHQPRFGRGDSIMLRSDVLGLSRSLGMVVAVIDGVKFLYLIHS